MRTALYPPRACLSEFYARKTGWMCPCNPGGGLALPPNYARRTGWMCPGNTGGGLALPPNASRVVVPRHLKSTLGACLVIDLRPLSFLVFQVRHGSALPDMAVLLSLPVSKGALYECDLMNVPSMAIVDRYAPATCPSYFVPWFGFLSAHFCPYCRVWPPPAWFPQLCRRACRIPPPPCEHHVVGHWLTFLPAHICCPRKQ